MITNIKEPIKKKQSGTSKHDLLIEDNAKMAVANGHPESVCPYQYDLRAKKIWVSAFKKEKRRVNKARAKD